VVIGPGPLKCLFKHCEHADLLLSYFIVFTKLLQQPHNHTVVNFPFTLSFLYFKEIKPHSSRYCTRPFASAVTAPAVTVSHYRCWFPPLTTASHYR